MATNDLDIANVLKEVNTRGNAFLGDQEHEGTKKELLEAARNLVASLESPFEVLARMNWLEPYRFAATRVGIDIGLFHAMTADNASPKSLDKLATATSCDPVLLSRLLKHLNAVGFVKQTGPNEYAANSISMALATRIPAAMTRNCYDFTNKVNAGLPHFLRNTQYKNPTNKDVTPFKYGMGTDLQYFDWISQPGMEQELEDFKAHMEFKTLGKKWFQSVDVEQVFDHPTNRDETLMIDIGGSAGHDIIDFHKAFPDLPGNLILQELPTTIKSLPPDFPKDIEAQSHDFFTPQPVQHAKAYYLHMVLHDWPDESCRKILSKIIPAMKKGYSKILLNEIVISDMDAHWFSTSVDMIMLAVHAAQERTESAWRQLVESVGLKITKIWDCDGNPEKILEIELQ